MDKRTLVFGKPIVSRTEAVQNYVNLVKHKNAAIGISPFFGIKALACKVLRIRQRFIYYCIDYYDPLVYRSLFDRIFIPLFIWLDRFLCSKADELWDISTRIAEGRRKFASSFRSTVVPLGYPPHLFQYREPINKNELVFVGLNDYGIELAEEVLKRNPDLRLKTYGKRPYLPADRLCELISCSGIGISLWREKGNAYYGDPGKTKLYSACGLPVIVSNFTEYSSVVSSLGAGIAIPYTVDALENAIKEILKNYDTYKRNVKNVWKFCDSQKIFRDLRLLEQG